MNNLPRRNRLWSIAIYTTLIASLLLFCIREKLIGDWGEGDFGSILVRCFFVGCVALFTGIMLKAPLPFGTAGFLRKLVIICLFISVLFYPLITQISLLEKSVGSVAHEIRRQKEDGNQERGSLFRQFPAEYEKFFEQKFKLSKWFVYLDALVKIYVLGVSPNNNVAVGKNGFYFEGWGARKVEKGIVENFDNIADYMGQIPFTENELKQWKRALEERAYWVRERGGEYVFVLAPTKALVYPEFLPSSLQRELSRGKSRRYQQLTNYLSEHADIHFIDVLPALLEAKEIRDYPLLFYKTDFHWNFYGAFIAYRRIISRLNEMFPQYGLLLPEYDDFELSVDEHWAHHRFMNMVGLPASMHKNEHYITVKPRPGTRWDGARDIPDEGIYDIYPPKRRISASDGSAMEIRMLLNPDAKIPSLLLLGDSFFEKCVYFFSGDGQKVMNYRTIVNFPEQIFNYEQPDIVIQEILNMFILRPPPTNPPGFSESFLRGKFADCAEHVIVRKTADQLVEMEGRFEVVLGPSHSDFADRLRILKIQVDSGKEQNLSLRFYDTGGRELERTKQLVGKGRSNIYHEIPGQMPHRVVATGETNGSGASFELRKFEIRFDG